MNFNKPVTVPWQVDPISSRFQGQLTARYNFKKMIFTLLIAVLFLTFSNGANDNFKGVATLWGSGTLNYRTALALATITTFAGSVCSYFFAEALIKNFSGKGLVPDEIAHSVNFVLSVALSAGTTVLLATRLGFPISTTHGLVGALVIAASNFVYQYLQPMFRLVAYLELA